MKSKITLQEVENGWTIEISRRDTSNFGNIDEIQYTTYNPEIYISKDYKGIIEILSKLINKG